MNAVVGKPFSLQEIKKKSVAIIKFGPPVISDGYRAGTYFQVTIDPKQISPSGDFVRLGNSPNDELVGWQKVDCLSVVEILGEWEDDVTPPIMSYGSGKLTMSVQEG